MEEEVTAVIAQKYAAPAPVVEGEDGRRRNKRRRTNNDTATDEIPKMKRLSSHLQPTTWSSVARAAQLEGGLLVGGRQECVWTTDVIVQMTGYFRGGRMVNCSGNQSKVNMEALRTGRPSSHLIDRPGSHVTREMRALLGDDVLSEDDRWFMDTVERGLCGCQFIINAMEDRLELRYATYFLNIVCIARSSLLHTGNRGCRNGRARPRSTPTPLPSTKPSLSLFRCACLPSNGDLVFWCVNVIGCFPPTGRHRCDGKRRSVLTQIFDQNKNPLTSNISNVSALGTDPDLFVLLSSH